MTEHEIVSAILNGVTAYETVTSVSLHEDQIAAEADTLRMRMIEEIDKEGLFRRPFTNYTQTIELNVRRRADQSGYIEVPKIFSLRSNVPAVAFIGSTDIKKPQPFRLMTGTSYVNSKHDLFVSTLPVAVYQDNYTIDLMNSSARKVRIIAVFEDPSDLVPFGYDDSETDYPMPNGMIDKLIGKATESYIRQLYRVPVQPNTQSDIPTRQMSK